VKDTSPIPRSRLFVAAMAATLLAIAICFRVMRLSSVPGVSGDEGWWGVQAIAWCSGRPYETHTTSGNPVDLLLLVPLGLLHAIASPSFLVLRTIPAAVNLLALPLSFWLVRRVYGDTTAWLHGLFSTVMLLSPVEGISRPHGGSFLSRAPGLFRAGCVGCPGRCHHERSGPRELAVASHREPSEPGGDDANR